MISGGVDVVLVDEIALPDGPVHDRQRPSRSTASAGVTMGTP